MRAIPVLLLVLISFKSTICDIGLKIIRNIDENYSMVTLGVEEKIGNNLTLSCELYNTGATDDYIYDDQIVWGKSTPKFRFKNKTDLEEYAHKKNEALYSLATERTHLNQAPKIFAPLKAEDEGTYFCGSLKYNIFKVVYIVVRDTSNQTRSSVLSNFVGDVREISYCNEKMFRCKSNGVCINQNYVCDNKPDCGDGSDESFETCKGEACKNKLQCDDGRCIPLYWCCDKHHDLECNVTYPPSCCQLLSESYEELEYGYVPYNMTQVRTNGTRYIFISLCILATFFSIVLMLLILSKIFLFAKKTSNGRDLFPLEEHTARSNARCYRTRNILSNIPPTCTVLRTEAIPTDLTNGTMDALLILSDEIIRDGVDRPPSYSDVMGQMEPPPPYTSQDCLNRD